MVTRMLANSASDEDSIRALIEEAFTIIKSGNFDPYFELFTEDAVWMLPSDFSDVGREKARSFYGFTKKFRFDQESIINEIGVSGDLAFARISLRGFLRPKDDPDGTPLKSVSRHIWLIERQSDGQWKITRDIWNNPKDVSSS